MPEHLEMEEIEVLFLIPDPGYTEGQTTIKWILQTLEACLLAFDQNNIWSAESGIIPNVMKNDIQELLYFYIYIFI